jgi:ABC-2 type transport system ATP-binding protein
VIASGSVNEIRSVVSRTRISCASTIAVDHVRAWPEVVEARLESDRLHVTATDAEAVVRRLLANDDALRHLEVRQAGLSEAFTELTKEAA